MTSHIKQIRTLQDEIQFFLEQITAAGAQQLSAIQRRQTGQIGDLLKKKETYIVRINELMSKLKDVLKSMKNDATVSVHLKKECDEKFHEIQYTVQRIIQHEHRAIQRALEQKNSIEDMIRNVPKTKQVMHKYQSAGSTGYSEKQWEG